MSFRRDGAPEEGGRRLKLLRAGFLIFGAVMVAQLFRIQVISHGFYAALAEGQRDIFQKLFPDRGRIYARDRKGGGEFLLAANQTLTTVFAEPFRIKDPKRAARLLAPLLEIDELELVAKLSDPEARYRALKKKVPDEVRAEIEALDLEGVGFAEEDYRFYPEGPSGAHVIGFVGATETGGREGRYGIEGWFDDELSGDQGFLETERDPLGRLIAVGNRKVTPAENGADVVLTVDRTVQHVVCRKLDEWVAAHGAARGAVVVLEPSTGAVIAMCSAPGFDPNDYAAAASIETFNNVGIFDPYEPGSIFKPITMAAALDDGKITPTTPFDDPGEVKIGPYTIRNSDLKAHGKVDMTEVLVESLNTGLIEVVHRLGAKTFLRYVRDFGFGAKVGLELQTEASGSVESLERKGDIWSATASYGQGITVTVLQMATAYAAIANGGVLMKPYIVDEIRREGSPPEKRAPKMVRRVIGDKAARLVTGMMVAVVERGHGKRAGVPGYWIAGKTGTAQIPRADGQGYEVGATIGSFAGFGPIDDPKFAMVVRVDRPKDVQFAESSAAPLFGDIAKFLLDYYEVPPSRK